MKILLKNKVEETEGDGTSLSLSFHVVLIFE